VNKTTKKIILKSRKQVFGDMLGNNASIFNGQGFEFPSSESIYMVMIYVRSTGKRPPNWASRTSNSIKRSGNSMWLPQV